MIPDAIPLPPSPAEILRDLAREIPEAAAEATVKGATWVVHGLAGMLDRSITVHADYAWFAGDGGPLQTMWRIARPVALLMLFLGVIQALYHGSVAELVRRALLMPAVGGVIGVVAVGVAQMISEAVGWMSATMIGTTGGPGAALEKMGLALQDQALAFPGAVIVISLIVMALGLLLWVELLLANAAVYLALLFWPIAMATLMWGAAAGVARKLAQIIIGLLLVPFVVTAALVLGTTMLTQVDRSAESLGVIMAGTATVALAVLSPFVLVAFVGAGTQAMTAGMGRRTLSRAGHASHYQRTTSPPPAPSTSPAPVLGSSTPRPRQVAVAQVRPIEVVQRVEGPRQRGAYALPRRERVGAST